MSYLLETYGAFRCIAVHPELEVVAYDVGCMVIVWNFRTDSKISLLKHEFEVIGLKFLESIENSKEMLVTLDCNGLGCLWDLDTGVCLNEFKYSSRSKIQKVFIQQFYGAMNICIGEFD